MNFNEVRMRLDEELGIRKGSSECDPASHIDYKFLLNDQWFGVEWGVEHWECPFDRQCYQFWVTLRRSSLKVPIEGPYWRILSENPHWKSSLSPFHKTLSVARHNSSVLVSVFVLDVLILLLPFLLTTGDQSNNCSRFVFACQVPLNAVENQFRTSIIAQNFQLLLWHCTSTPRPTGTLQLTSWVTRVEEILNRSPQLS